MKKDREGYKKKDLGEIPENWEVKKLEEICEFLDSKRKPIKEEDRIKMKGNIPYYGASGIIDWVNDFIFDDELILLGEDGENIKSRNVPLAFKIKGKCWINNHAHVLKIIDKDRNNIDYITYTLEKKDYSSYIIGSAQPKLNQEQCRKLLIVIPPFKEQQKIADILSTVDEHIEETESLIEKTKELKKGLMQRLLTKGIGHTIFKKTEVGEIPVDWEVKKLEQLFSINNNSINPYEYDEKFLHYSIPAYDDLGKPLYQWGSEIKSSKFVIDRDSILVSKLNPRIKRVWKVEYIKDVRQVCSTEFINFVPIHREVNKDFYYQYFLSDIFQYELLVREKGTTGSRKRVSPCDTNNILIVLPPLQEQKKIADCLMSIDLTIGQYSSKMNKMNELKQVLMQKLLTGKIRVKV